jgi:hypothetical protein
MQRESRSSGRLSSFAGYGLCAHLVENCGVGACDGPFAGDTRREALTGFASQFTIEVRDMCRNIKMLFNFDPPVTEEEVRAASLQFVRKISGFSKPSKANEAAFLAAVDEVASVSTRLLRSLETTAPPRNREEEAAKAKARGAARFGT